MKDVLGATQGIGGQMSELAKKMMENPVDLAAKKAAAGTDLLTTIGEQTSPVLDGLNQKVVDVENSMNNWLKQQPALAKGLGLTALAAGGLGAAIGGVSGAIGVAGTVRGAGLLAGGLGKAGTALAGGAATALGGAAAGTAAVGGLGLAGYEAYKHWDTLKDVGGIARGFGQSVADYGLGKTLAMEYDPRGLLSDLGIMDNRPEAAVPAVPNEQQRAPEGRIVISVDDNGRATIKSMNSTGVELAVGAGTIMNSP
jgi:hypothetical protein